MCQLVYIHTGEHETYKRSVRLLAFFFQRFLVGTKTKKEKQKNERQNKPKKKNHHKKRAPTGNIQFGS